MDLDPRGATPRERAYLYMIGTLLGALFVFVCAYSAQILQFISHLL